MYQKQSSIFSPQALSLIGATFLWGASYFLIEHALHNCGPFWFVGLRFLPAGLLTAFLFYKNVLKISYKDIWVGIILGFSAYIGQVLQTIALQTITITQCAFLTSLYVPLVPIFQIFFMRRLPTLMTFIGIIIAFIGLLCMSAKGATGISFSFGDILTILAAVSYAADILLISLLNKHTNVICVTSLQLVTCGLFSLISMPFFHENIPSFSWDWCLPIIGMSLASIAIQFAMNWAQKTISPTKAAIIYAGEPVWGAIFGFFAGERLGKIPIFGAFMIIIGTLISQIFDKKKKG